jgi:predicted RNA binding protein YcfA (HicA-like mRNA interferase family)
MRPPLTFFEVREIVVALGFTWKRKVGSHSQYEKPANGNRKRAVVTIDEAIDQFDDFLIKSMIGQSGYSREQFYGATRKTAKKAGLPLFVVADYEVIQNIVVTFPEAD